MSDFTPNTYRANQASSYINILQFPLTRIGHLIRDRLSLSEENPIDISNMSIACIHM